MKAHPIADIYPLIDDSQLEQLVESIQRCGQLQPIILLDGQILDGRCRWTACKKARVEPQTKEYRGKKDWASLVAFVQAANEHRRHLTASQRAVVAFKLTKMAPDKNRNFTVSQAEAAEKQGVSESLVERASKVVQHAAAAVVEAVEAGEVKVADAAAIVDLPKREQVEALKAVQSGEAKTLRGAVSELSEQKPKTDELGQQLPAKLVAIFEAADEFDRQARSLNSLKQWADSIVNHAAARYLDVPAIHGEIRKIKSELRLHRPYAICPYCEAKKSRCDACKGGGFVTKQIYDMAPSELRM